jgi:hypothetical protein
MSVAGIDVRESSIQTDALVESAIQAQSRYKREIQAKVRQTISIRYSRAKQTLDRIAFIDTNSFGAQLSTPQDSGNQISGTLSFCF